MFYDLCVLYKDGTTCKYIVWSATQFNNKDIVTYDSYIPTGMEKYSHCVDVYVR
jgi:hypothetical protein